MTMTIRDQICAKARELGRVNPKSRVLNNARDWLIHGTRYSHEDTDVLQSLITELTMGPSTRR